MVSPNFGQSMQSTPQNSEASLAPELAAFEEYRRSRSPQAFELLVRHYADLVYASALRQLRDRLVHPGVTGSRAIPGHRPGGLLEFLTHVR